MDETGNRSQIRPYYDPTDFNAGYSSVFRLDEGVVDGHGHTLASKLNIAKSIGRSTSSGVLSEFSKGQKLLRTDTDGKSIDNMEWGDFVDLGVWNKIVGQLLDQFLRRYLRHLVQQPFEVARCLLQVGDFSDLSGKDQLPLPVELRDEEDQDEDIDFFPQTSENPQDLAHGSHQEPIENLVDEGKDLVNKVEIKPESIHTMDIATSVMDNEGIRGLWKANNTTFIYNVLSVTLDAWFTGLISPFLGIPDPYFMDLIHSPDLKASVLLTLSASAFTKMLLLPLDIIRTRLMVTSMQRTRNDRSLRKLAHRWSWRKDGLKIPGDMWILTVLQSVTGVIFNKLFDVLIYHQLNVEKHSQVGWYNTLKLASQTIELFVKLPLENLLRRCQVNYLIKGSRDLVKQNDLVIRPMGYDGIWSSLGNRRTTSGLWNGWRIGLMSLVGGYGFNILNIDSIDREQEKF